MSCGKGNAIFVSVQILYYLCGQFTHKVLFFTQFMEAIPGFLNELNPAQREAVEYTDGPSLVVAGAGSGKTRVLTYKVAYLLWKGLAANRILALTFTNKAAREMKERIYKLVGEEKARYLWMGTFHSVCARILRQEADGLGYTHDFSIYDTQDSKSVVKQIIKDHRLDEKVYKPSLVLSRISSAKNALLTPQNYALNKQMTDYDRMNRLYEMPNIYEAYDVRLKQANAMDFDDLLMNMCLLLQRNDKAREYYQNIFKYILVDEYQDTNYAQYLIVRLLSEPQNKVCVVGDDAQSIYSFRGADIRNILTFRRGYADARLFKLERNYRSTKTIVNAANSLIRHNEGQIPKNVYSENEDGARLQLTAYMSDRDEAVGVVREIAARIGRGVMPDDVAVLYRTNAQSRVFENEMRKQGVAYRIYGSTSFYQRKEIKDAIAYLRLAANPKDNEALLRVVKFPARGIGSTTMNAVIECAAANRVSLYEVLTSPQPHELNLSAAPKKRLAGFVSLLQNIQEAVDTKDAFEFADYALKVSGVMAAVEADKSQEGIDRKQNIDELLSGIHEFVDNRLQEGVSFTPIQDFLADVSLLTDQDERLDDTTPRVTLMTVHAAKGLEFKEVYIAGLEQDLFPSQFCTSPSEIEEERRLLYVAITRAMERCSLSFARSRFHNGQVRFSSPSSFLEDIDRQYLLVSEPLEPSVPVSRIRWEHSTWQEPAKESVPAFSAPVQQRLRSVSGAVTPIENASFAAGDRVEHRVFGAGTVEKVYRDNGNDKIDIRFVKVGVKTLLLAYAKLEKI